MELVKDFVNNQLTLYMLPVVLVIVVVILVFTFGFKSAEQPHFDKLTNDDRKQAGKKKKIKEKKTTANGHVSTGDSKNEKSPVKESKKSPTKENSDVQKLKDKKVENNKQIEKNKKNEAIKNKVFTSSIEEAKNKKNTKKQLSEKPVDFDDGNWETVPSKADKKKKPDQSPAKKDKKAKKTEKATEIEKFVKEVVNKELREKEKEVQIEKPVEEPVQNEEPIVLIEEKKEKEKKKEKKAKKETEKPLIEKEPPVQKEVVAIPNDETISEEEIGEEAPKPPIKEGGVAFDELGDIWTEAKAVKKSKKKARRDN